MLKASGILQRPVEELFADTEEALTKQIFPYLGKVAAMRNKVESKRVGRSEKNRNAGRIGGLQTWLRFGSNYMQQVARRGGRPTRQVQRKELGQCKRFSTSVLGGMVTKEVNGSAAAMLPSAKKGKKTGKSTRGFLPLPRL